MKYVITIELDNDSYNDLMFALDQLDELASSREEGRRAKLLRSIIEEGTEVVEE